MSRFSLSVMDKKRSAHLIKEPGVLEGPDMKKQKRIAGLENGDATSNKSLSGRYIDEKPRRKTIFLAPQSIPQSGVGCKCKSKFTRKYAVLIKPESSVARDIFCSTVDKGALVPKLSKGGSCSIPLATEEKRLSASELLIQIRQRERENAKKKIESMACTAGLNENLNSLHEIEMLMGVQPQQGSMAQYYSYKSPVY